VRGLLKGISEEILAEFPDGIIAIDTRTRQIYEINDTAGKLFGYKRKEIIGKDVLILHPASQKEKIKKLISELETKKSHYLPDIPFVRKNGEIFFVDIAFTRVNYNGFRIAVGFLRERGRIIKKTCDWNLLYVQLAEMSGYGTCIISDRKFAFVNNKFVEMIGGRSASELVDKDVYSIIPQQDQENLICIYENLISGMIPAFAVNQKIKRLDGGETVYLIKGVRTGFNGQPAAHCIIMEANSEKQQTFEKLPDFTDEQRLMTALTKRESEIMCLIAAGKTTKQIAGRLNIAYHTVMTHKHNIMQKLQIRTTADLILFAIRNGFVRFDAAEKTTASG